MSDEARKPKVVVVMPAYNAGRTLRMTYEELPKDTVSMVILVDDGSTDATLEVARQLGLEIFVHNRNYGYGANQKTCYAEALRAGADVVLLVGVHHHAAVGAGARRLRIARLLVRAIAVIPVVDEDLEPELARDVERLVGRAVVDEDDRAHGVLRQLFVRHTKRPARVIGWHHDHDLGCAERRHAGRILHSGCQE